MTLRTRTVAASNMLAALQAIAAPVIKAYHDDLNVHDAKVLASFKPGDVMLWAPNPHGTHLIVLARQGRPNASAKEHFDAVVATSGKAALDWYLLSEWVENGAVSWQATQIGAAAATVQRWHAKLTHTAAPVRELHL